MRREHILRLLAWLIPSLSLVAVAIVLLLARGPTLRVSAHSPATGKEDIPITTGIHLTFSEAMDRASVEARFQTGPETDGRFQWVGNELVYRPRSALLPDTSYTVSLLPGAVSERGATLEAEYTWTFRTRQPQLLYLGRLEPEAQERQLYAASIGDLEIEQLTDHPFGVWDYAVHPEGEAIIYSVLRQDGGSDLWHMDRSGAHQQILLTCVDDACLNPAWSPDGRLVAYERRAIWPDTPNLDPQAGQIWLLDLERNQERSLFDYDVPLHSPVWNPRGERLAYVSPLIPGIEVYDLSTGETQQFANHWGQAPVWAPDGSQMIAADLLLVEEALAVRLVLIDLENEHLVDISGEDLVVKDQGPAWSPGGGWIAYGRQFLDEERWTPGRQIWLIRPDGSEAYPLLVEPPSDLFGLKWRPDGAALAYLREDLSEGPQLSPDVSVWVLDLLTREAVFVADHGIMPRWVP